MLDLSQGVAGGYCTKVLADLGAEVLKVEPTRVGDCGRRAGPFLNDVPSPETSAPFLYLNARKKSVTLDINTRTGVAILSELARGADILVESDKPGTMASLGLGYATLQQDNPSLVMASLSCFGQSGPYRDYEGCDIVAYAVSGYMYLTGDEDEEPLKAGGFQSGYQAGIQAALAIVAALTYRDFTGQGQYLDVSAIEALASTFDGVGLYTTLERQGFMPRRNGTRLINRDPHYAYPSALLPCRDGWVHVHYSPGNPEGLAFLTDNPRLASSEVMGAMMGHADEIDQMLVEWLRDHTRLEIQTAAQEVRVPFTMVHSIPEVLEDPQNAAMGSFVEVDHPVAGKLRYVRSPLRVGGGPWPPARAPLLGEHNREVYCQRLGYTEKDLIQLRALDII